MALTGIGVALKIKQPQQREIAATSKMDPVNIYNHQRGDLSTSDSSVHVPRENRDGIRLDSRPEKIQFGPHP